MAWVISAALVHAGARGVMATIKPAMEPEIRRAGARPFRYFFPGMAGFAVVILLAAFVPEIRKYAAGTFPIAWVLHIHAAIMFAWVGAFALQAYLGATGRTAIHRRTGSYAIGLGWLAWASMIFVEFRGFVAHPLPTDPAEYDWNLPGPFVYLTFGVFLAWAVHERRRPQWHKRLMTFALFLSLEAAMQRFAWIPRTYDFGGIALVLDMSLLGPLFAYDLRALRGRLHPATIRGMVVLLASEAALFSLWGTAGWRNFACIVAHRLHG